MRCSTVVALTVCALAAVAALWLQQSPVPWRVHVHRLHMAKMVRWDLGVSQAPNSYDDAKTMLQRWLSITSSEYDETITSLDRVQHREWTTSMDHHNNVSFITFRGQDAPAKSPLVLWVPSGHWAMDGRAMAQRDREWLASVAREVPCTVLVPYVPSSLQQPFPAALEYTYDALRWARVYAQELDIDPDHIIIGGEGSGANVAAALGNRVARQGLPYVRAMWLIAPLVDLLGYASSSSAYRLNAGAHMMFTRAGVLAYASDGDVAALDGVADASPIEVSSWVDVAPTLIQCGAFDPLFGESSNYVLALQGSDVFVTSHLHYNVDHEGLVAHRHHFPHESRTALNDAVSWIQRICEPEW